MEMGVGRQSVLRILFGLFKDTIENF